MNFISMNFLFLWPWYNLPVSALMIQNYLVESWLFKSVLVLSIIQSYLCVALKKLVVGARSDEILGN